MGWGKGTHILLSPGKLAAIAEHKDETDSGPHASYSLSFRFKDGKRYRKHISNSGIVGGSKVTHIILKHPQTALPETTLMSYRWSLIVPLAKGTILIGVICIS